jgi:hypothetical protein
MIVFAEPLKLPDGTEVVVRIDPVEQGIRTPPSSLEEDFASLPVFGMWADREDMQDGAAWVRRERSKWRQRAQERD